MSAIAVFLRESLGIEGIHRPPTEKEIAATDAFLDGAMTAEAVIVLQQVYAPGKPLRDQPGMNVRVGNYTAPPGNRDMRETLHRCVSDWEDPWLLHVEFEKLHPFIDGNGRTGRSVWAWAMIRTGQDPFSLSFLHRFYYQTLAAQS